MNDVERREEQYEREVDNFKKRKRVLDQITEEIVYYENVQREDDYEINTQAQEKEQFLRPKSYAKNKRSCCCSRC